METETHTDLSATAQVYSTPGGNIVVTDVMDAEAVLLAPEALQALVQYAYDRHGILASPSYALEAERAEDKARGCPCGMDGCSDRPAYVAEYRAGLQVGGL